MTDVTTYTLEQQHSGSIGSMLDVLRQSGSTWHGALLLEPS